MAEGTRTAKRTSSPNWLASLVGAVFLIAAGFALGLVVGVVREEPDLVIGHVAGQSQDVPWTADESGELPPVAAGPVITDDPVDGAAYDAAGAEEVVIDTPVISAEDIASPAYAAPSEPAAPAQPAAPAPRPNAATSAERSGFSVQVGAFAQSSAAEEVAGGLRSKGYPVYVTPSANPNDGRWRVRVGPLPTRSEADEIAGRLKAQERLPTWVLIEGGG